MRPDPIPSYGDDLAVVTVVRPSTDPAALDRLVRSVRGATTRLPRIVAAVSGPTAPVVPDGVVVLGLGEDVGRAAAVNRAVAGLDPAVGWVAVAGPEAEWAGGALDVLLAAARPRAGALGPALRDPGGRAIAGGGDVPTAGQVLRGLVPSRVPEGGVVGWLPASCLLLRRVALDSVDGFDPRYVAAPDDAALDDADLGDRLGRAGWLCLRVPEAIATVHPTVTTGAERSAPARRRYVYDRSPAVARALLGLAGCGPRS